ncbi:MAG: tRNA (adenosine(37)-N6)-dimethylallyltransferase MiaA [Thermodesulfovibrionales bacterium]|nr:tRNA (adenosine(37)-N6)-dimethylallyltransferase MiaA [Thermodesulfovibrionales bacterium]
MNKVIILLGPTGVGKTEVSILLAKALDTEIISADSMQIYRGMDIGTAKPSEEQRMSVKHHMIDIISPSEPYSVGRYIEDVTPVIDELHRKGKIPIIAGGTGLYIKAMTRGIFSGPSADWKLREELASLEEGQSGALYSYLQELDPEAASKIMPADTRRIIRALEVCLKTKKGISEFQQKLTTPLPYEFIKIGLRRERKELYRMLEARVDKMIEAGLVDEVKKLIAIHPFSDSPIHLLSSMQAIGYKEIAMYLNGEIPFEEAIRLIKRSTKRYAKRQFTWFNKEEDILWIDITGIQDVNEILKHIKQILDGLIQNTG